MKHCAICGITEDELELIPVGDHMYICICCSAWGMEIEDDDVSAEEEEDTL